MLHADLHTAAAALVCPRTRTATTTTGSIIQQANIPPRNDLSQPAVDGIPHLDIAPLLADEDQVHAFHEAGLLGFAHVIHDHGPRDFAVLVDVQGQVLEREEEFDFREPEHAQGTLVGGAVLHLLHGGGAAAGAAAGVVGVRGGGGGGGGGGVEVGDGEGEFLVEGEDLETLGGGDGERAVEEVDGVGVAPDVELVEFAEEGSGAAARGGPGGLDHAA